MARLTIGALWSGSGADLRELALDKLLAASGAPRAAFWATALPLLRDALPADLAGSVAVCLDHRLLRVGRRIDAVIVTDRAVLALLIRPGAARFSPQDRRLVEDAALDLADFHAGCAGQVVLPVLVVPNGARPSPVRSLMLPGVGAVVEATRLLLPGLIRDAATGFPRLARPIRPASWAGAAYRPVPGIVDAACLLYARHDVTAIADAGADVATLAGTNAVIRDAVATARADGRHIVVFVTGAPGAGKTLCGLAASFTPGEARAFLTGNPTLVHVLREALARDAAVRGGDLRAARQRMECVIQALPRFRDHHVAGRHAPAERVVVIDEAQRCWSRAHAVGKIAADITRFLGEAAGRARTRSARPGRPGCGCTTRSRATCWTLWRGTRAGPCSSACSAAGRRSMTARVGWRNGAQPSRPGRTGACWRRRTP